VLAVAAGLALGALTAYAQGWLPHQIGSLANSSGPWLLVGFAVALTAREARGAALAGVLALASLLVGYAIAVEVRGDAASSALIVFWGAAALVVGPLVGLFAHWVATRRDALAALGAGAASGVLIGEGIYGVVEISDTTYTPYWWCEIAVGALLLAAIAWLRLRRPAGLLVALPVAALTAAAFVVLYRADLISVLP
jgi:hypothetical protein